MQKARTVKWAFLTRNYLSCLSIGVDLQEAADLSPAAVTKLAKDEYVRLDVLVRVCCALGVDIGDIMEVTKDE